MLLLSACFTASPLAPTDAVSIEGQLQNEDGTAFANAPVKLVIPFGTDKSARSNAAGIYRFDLKGSETQFSGVASELEVVAETDAGQQVRQPVTVLKTSSILPRMRFWDGLQAPAGQTVLTGNRSIFSWQTPGPEVHDYLFFLRNQTGELVWKSKNLLPSLELPLAVMEAGQHYTWQVSANTPDYQTFSRQRQVMAEPELKTLPIREVQQLNQSKVFPSFHDGTYQFQLSDRLELPKKGQLDLVISLAQKSRIQGLYWSGGGFETQVEVRTQAGAAPILTHSLRDFALLEWPAVETDKLYLRLSAEQGGFTDITEIRLLG